MRGEVRKRSVNVLLIEDSDDDAAAFTEVLAQSVRQDGLHRAHGVDDALDFVHRRGAHVDAPRPDLIFLDLQLPGQPGMTLLAELKGDPALQPIPVVVLSASADEADVAACYDAQANSYLEKPTNQGELAALGAAIRDYWLTVVQLPPR